MKTKQLIEMKSIKKLNKSSIDENVSSLIMDKTNNPLSAKFYKRLMLTGGLPIMFPLDNFIFSIIHCFKSL
jgi:hypothetical protein